MKQFRYSLHRNSPAIKNMIKNVKRDGYFFRDGRKYKLINARKEGVNIHLTIEKI